MSNVIILGLVSFFTDISSEMIYPLVPLFLTATLGATPAIVGIISGLAESLAVLLKVWVGYFSDKIKRRKSFAALGYALSSLGKLFLFLSASWLWVLGARMIDRIGKGVRTAPRDALIAESSRGDRRGAAFGLHRTLDTLGAIAGIILAYFFLTVYQGNYRKIFLIALLPAVLGVLSMIFVKEKKEDAPRFPLKNKGGLAPGKLLSKWAGLDERLKKFLFVALLFSAGNSSNYFLLLRAKDVGFGAAEVILLYLAFNAIYGLFAYPAAKFSDKIGRKKILVAGYFIYGLVYLGFALIDAPFVYWPLFGIYGLYMGLTDGVEKAFLTDVAPRDSRATIIGLHATLIGVGLLFASVTAGFFWSAWGASAPFYFGGGLGILAAVGLWKFI